MNYKISISEQAQKFIKKQPVYQQNRPAFHSGLCYTKTA